MNPNRKILLIVDDLTINRKKIKDFLKEAPFDFIEAGGGRECLRKLANKPVIDLGLIDFEMPGINGAQLIKMIRKEPIYADVPFIMLSRTSDEKTVLQSIRAGAKDYLVKPFAHKTLLLKIRNLLP